eukprot:Skav229382  [mRNA]  locus=scaffold584:204408:205634:+ [translate_table: standard]
MWLAGGVDRERWYGHRFLPGQLVEGAVRDDAGKAQGTLLMEVLKSVSTETNGHWVEGKFILASDGHMQWWMSHGAGTKIKDKGMYHFCEGPAVDCQAKRKGVTIHMEKFRVVTQKLVDQKSPSWAFGRGNVKVFNDYLNARKDPLESGESAQELPWAEKGSGEEGSGSSSSSSEEGEALAAKLKKARDQLKELEKLTAERVKRKGTSSKKKRSKKEKKDAKEEVPAKGSGSKKAEPKETKKSKKAKEAKEKDKKSKRKAETTKEERSSKKKSRKSSSSSASTDESEEQEALFGEEPEGGQKRSKGHKDRGPFGAGEARSFKVKGGGEGSSGSESHFRDAPAEKSASNQVRLVQYAKSTPGRLASRMLQKMQTETARGIVGADNPESSTPVVASHYLLTMLLPQLGSKL